MFNYRFDLQLLEAYFDTEDKYKSVYNKIYKSKLRLPELVLSKASSTIAFILFFCTYIVFIAFSYTYFWIHM